MFFEAIDGHRDLLGEGPFWDQETGTLWTADILNCLIRARRPGGEEHVYELPDVVSAAIPRASGGLLLTMRDGAYLFETQTGELTPFAKPDTDPGNRSNESRTDPEGRLWLGTMQYKPLVKGRSEPLDSSSGTMSMVRADGTFETKITGVGITNTLCWSAAGDWLVTADSLANVMWKYPFNQATGELGERTIFSQIEGHGVPDGSAIDNEDHIWNARFGAGCIIRFKPSGEIERIVDVPVKQPTSCVFGRADMQDLFVTSARIYLSAADLEANPLEGATLAARAPVSGQACVRFAG